jgi:hypothetical protein
MSALSVMSPEAFFQTKWKASLEPHMFSPPPVMRYSPLTGS